MPDLTAQRTLVKSPPELWSEVSEVESLAKHLGELGEIRITKVEPESTVAWEGELISGTVELEQSGWGTKVTFNVTVPEPEPAEAPVEPEPDPATVEPEPAAEPRRRLWSRLFRKRQLTEPEADSVDSESEPELAAEAEPEAATAEADRIQGILAGTLDSLGQAHHRPFSRG